MESTYERLNTLDYFMAIAHTVSQRGTCPRRQVGAVLVRDNRVVSTGYNGSPPGMPHCLDVGCTLNDTGNCVATIHAEQNCIISAGHIGDALYTTDEPCVSCLKIIIAHNPRIRIFYHRPYPDKDRKLFLNNVWLLAEEEYPEFELTCVSPGNNHQRIITLATGYERHEL